MLVADLLDAYRAERAPIVVSVQRLDTTSKALRRHLGDRPAGEIARALILEYGLLRAGEGVRPATVRRELVTLRAAVRLAWADGRLSAAPRILMPPAGTPRQRVLDQAEIARLRHVASRHPPLDLFIALALGTGARRGAILDLVWPRVDLVHSIIDFRASGPKAERQKHRAIVPITPRLAKLLRARRQPDGFVVDLTPSTLGRRFNVVAEFAGLRGVTPHVLRHTSATHLLRHVPLVLASRMIGHRSVAVTEQVYGHLTVEDLLPAARALDTLLR